MLRIRSSVMRSPFVLVLILSLLSTPAGAQATGGIWFSGMEHEPLGQAVLNASPDGESLEITGIGNSGEDGVVVQLGESQFIQFEFDDFDPDLLPAGTAVTMEGRVQGATGTMESFGIITFAVTPNQDLSFSADYSPIGSNTYTALVLDQGNVIYTLPGIPNGDGLIVDSSVNSPFPPDDPPPPKPYISIEEHPVFGVITKVCIVIRRKPIIFPGGDTVIGDTIMFTPDAPSTVGTTLPTEIALHVSGTPSLTLASTWQKFNDIEVSGTGSAHVESYETTDGTLEVSNIGPSGLDGFAVNTANTSYAEITLSPDTAIEPNPGAVIALRSLNDGGGERGSMRAEANAAGQWGFSAEFQGSDTYSMKVFNNDTLVYEASSVSGIGASSAGKPIGFYQNLGVTDGGCILCGILDGLYSITTNSGNTVTGNAIQFINETPISGCSTELVLGGANLQPFAVVNVWDGGGAENCFNGTDDDGDGLVDGEDPDCGCIKNTWFSGMYTSAAGGAGLYRSPDGESLEITGIGDSGEDGVVVDLAESQFIEFEIDGFDPDLLPAGTTVTMEDRGPGAAGTLSSLGSITATVTDTQDFAFSADFSQIGSDTYTVTVLDNGEVVYTQSGIPIGDIGASAKKKWRLYREKTTDSDGNTTVTWCIERTDSASSVGIVTNTGETFFGTAIMILPDTVIPNLPDTSHVALLASGTPSLTLARTSQKFNGLRVSGKGSAHVVSQETSSGTLEVSNIGASGLDGFSVDTSYNSFNEITFSDDAPIEPTPSTMVELVESESGNEVATVRAEANPDAEWQFSATYLGSPTYTMDIYDGADLVYSASGLDGIGATAAGPLIRIYRKKTTDSEGNTTIESCIEFSFSLGIVTNNGETVIGNSIMFRNDTPFPAFGHKLVLRGENLPEFSISDIHWAFENCSNGIDDDGDGAVDCDDSECTFDPGCSSEFDFSRGDTNGDGGFDIADAINLLTYLFGSGSVSCLSACDGNDDGSVDVADAITILAALFSGGELPPTPGPGSCGPDPTSDTLGCEESACP